MGELCLSDGIPFFSFFVTYRKIVHRMKSESRGKLKSDGV